MKNLRRINLLLLATLFVAFASCKKDEVVPEKNVVIDNQSIYIVNFGKWKAGNGDISIYNEKDTTIQNNVYASVNGIELGSNIESFAIHNGRGYFMSNEGDKIDIVDAATFEVAANPISEGIVTPRYFAAKGNTAYISCWGDYDYNADTIKTSYIAVVDLTSNTVTKQIPLFDGPEGLHIVGDKLYASLEFEKRVAVMDLNTYEIKHIELKAVAQHFVEDNSGNLWVSQVSTYSRPSGADSLGLAVIDPSNDVVLDYVNFPGIGGDGYLAINADNSTIYVMGAEAWPGTKTSVYEVDVNGRTLASSPLVEGEGYYGMGYNQKTDKLYVMINPDYTNNGSLQVYSKDGVLEHEVETGVGPKQVVFY